MGILAKLQMIVKIRERIENDQILSKREFIILEDIIFNKNYRQENQIILKGFVVIV